MVSSVTVLLSFNGSDSATSSRGNTISFNSSDTLQFSVTDTVVESFTVSAEQQGIPTAEELTADGAER